MVCSSRRLPDLDMNALRHSCHATPLFERVRHKNPDTDSVALRLERSAPSPPQNLPTTAENARMCRERLMRWARALSASSPPPVLPCDHLLSIDRRRANCK